MKKFFLILILIMTFMFAVNSRTEATSFNYGGDRLIDTQNNDGGWDWPLDNGDPMTGSAPNTAAPIAMGLLAAYEQTGDIIYLNAAIDAGVFVRDVSPPHATGNGIFMHALSQATGDSQYANDVKTEYYDALSGGTYVRGSTSYDTASYAQHIRDVRAGDGNLAAWDLGLAAVGAHRLCADTNAWIVAIEAELNEFDSTAYYDVLGLSGAIWAFSEIGHDFDPITGDLEAAGSTSDLAATLADYQLATGGFTWNSGWMDEGDDNETIQETAYAILALNEFERSEYLAAIQKAGDYIASTQLATGGWKNWAGGAENNEVTGEALWGASAANPVPEPTTMLLLGSGIIGLAGFRRKFRKS
jgi:hypothetical protein